MTNASQVLGRIPLKVLRVLAPATPVYSSSRAAVTLVFSRPVIELGSNFLPEDGSGDSVNVNGVAPLLWACDGEPKHEPPISGRSWWVTTSIMRFDPSVQWGNDLHCTVWVNPLLRSWDGAQLTGAYPHKSFNTSALTLGNTAVSSELARIATDGAWRPLLGEETAYECPSDCRVTLGFSHRIDKDVLSRHLCLMKNTSWPGGQCRRVQVQQLDSECAPCPSSAATWVVVPPRLEDDTSYLLVLPKGVTASNTSGPTLVDLKQKLHGLRPFEFPFLPTTSYQAPAIAAPQVSLYVRHGLPAETPPSEVQKAVSLTSPKQKQQAVVVHREHNDLTLQPSKTHLILESEFVPSTGPRSHQLSNYTFQGDASASLKDAFGQSLRQSQAKYHTAQLAAFEVQPIAFSGFFREEKESIGLVALARGKDTQPKCGKCHGCSACPDCNAEGSVTLRAQPVGGSELEDVLMLAFVNCSNLTANAAVWSDEAATFGPQPSNTVVEEWKFGELVSGSAKPWVLAQHTEARPSWQPDCERSNYWNQRIGQKTCSLYTSAPFAVSVIQQLQNERHSSQSTHSEVLVLVTDYTDVAAVVGADVTLFEIITENNENDCCRKKTCPCS